MMCRAQPEVCETWARGRALEPWLGAPVGHQTYTFRKYALLHETYKASGRSTV